MKFQYLFIQIMCCYIYPSLAQDICESNNSPCSCQIVYTALSYRQRIKMDCSGSHVLTEIPDIPSSTLILDFSNNRLNSNSIDGLCSYGYLEDVNLSSNQLTYIPPYSLDKCYIANSLNLSGNVFDIIETNSFKGLDETQAIYGLTAKKFSNDSLSGLQEATTLELNILQMDTPETLFKNLKVQRLHLGFTKAVDIPESLFSPLSETLQHLSIRAPKTQNVPGNLFRDLRRLRDLEIMMPELHHLPTDLFQSNSSSLRRLHINGINTLGQQTFANLTSLKILRINTVQNLPSELFKGLESLEILDLSNSEVQKLPTDFLKSLVNLQSLSLRDVGLSNLTESDLVGLDSLRNLDLSHNQISELSAYLFYEIKSSVDAIDLSHNKIKTVSGNLFAKNTTLRKLHLNDNGISIIESHAFSNLADLEEIHLQNNRISKLPVNVFDKNMNLRYADLAMNKLNVFPDLMFANNKNLAKLNLMDNQIGFKNPITSSMISLKELNMNNNNVSCDCKLVQSMKNVQRARVLGECEMLNGTKRAILAHVKGSVDLCPLELKEETTQTTTTIQPVTETTSTSPATSSTTSTTPRVKPTTTKASTSTKSTTQYRKGKGNKVTRKPNKSQMVMENQMEIQDITEKTVEVRQMTKKSNDVEDVVEKLNEVTKIIEKRRGDIEIKEEPSEELEVVESIRSTFSENNATEKLGRKNLEIGKTTINLEPSETMPTITITTSIDTNDRTDADNVIIAKTTDKPTSTIGGNFEDQHQAKEILSTAANEITNDKPLPTILADPLNPTDPAVTLISPTGTISPNITNSSSDNVHEVLYEVNTNGTEDVDLDNNKTILFVTDPSLRGTLGQSTHFITIALMLAIVIICIGVVLCVYKRRHQSHIYQVSRSLDHGKDLMMDGLGVNNLGDISGLSDMKEAPYVQIEKVDELGIVHTETVPDPNGQINTTLMEPHMTTMSAELGHFEQDQEHNMDFNNSTGNSAEINEQMGDGNHCMEESTDNDLKP